MPRRVLLILAAFGLVVATSLAAAQTAAQREARALMVAKREAAEAVLRSEQLEGEARAATNEAARVRAEAAALAADIEAAEADITAAETRVRIIENLRAAQRARLAERQEPVVRLTAALQTMARRPAALALVQPGSLHELVHVRALLASTLPIIRARTERLREEVGKATELRAQADRAVVALVASQNELKRRRQALARLEADQRRRSESLIQSASFESDRALALTEEARELTSQVGTLEEQDRLRQRLADLPGPRIRPLPSERKDRRSTTRRYRVPVEGRLLSGMGEISPSGVHARGLTFETEARTPVVAPASGHIVYAGPFRGYGKVVMIDHGGGWISTLTNLATIEVRTGDSVKMGRSIGRTGNDQPRLGVELRNHGRPVAIAPMLMPG